MKLTIYHIIATIVGAGAGIVFVGFILAIPVLVILGDNPPSDHPVLRFYDILWYSSPFTGAAIFNYLIYRNRRNRRKEIERKNMTTEEILKRARRT